MPRLGGRAFSTKLDYLQNLAMSENCIKVDESDKSQG